MWRWMFVVFLAGIAFYAANAAHFVDQPLRIEENEWPPMARAIYEHGEPVLAADQTHKVRFTPELTRDRSDLLGAWHPPLYLYTLAGVMAFAGTDASWGLRALGALSLLACCALFFLIAREVDPRRWKALGAAGSTLLLVHPYAIQGSLFIDIDTGIYAPLVLIVLWLALRYAPRDGPVAWPPLVAITSALVAVMWAKLTTAIVLVAVLAFWWVIVRRSWRGVAEIGAVITVATVAFFSTYWGWCQLTGIPFSYTFDVTFAEKQGRLLDRTLVEQAVHWHVSWLMPALLVLVAVYGIDLLRHLWVARSLRQMDLLWIFGVAVLVLYVFLSPTDGTYQGKYAFPALPPLVLAVTWLVLRDARSLSRRGLLAAVIAVAVAVLAALLTPDLLTDNGYAKTRWLGKLAIGFGAAAAILVAWRGAGRAFPVGALIVCVALFVGQSVRSYQADTSPMYPVADTNDFIAGVRQVRNLIEGDQIVFGGKDLTFYVDGPIIEGQDAFIRGDDHSARVLREKERVTVVATTSFGPGFGPLTGQALAECFREVGRWGFTAVLVRRRTC